MLSGSDRIWKERCRQSTGNALHGTTRQGGSEGDALQRNATRATACGTAEADGDRQALRIDEDI